MVTTWRRSKLERRWEEASVRERTGNDFRLPVGNASREVLWFTSVYV